MSEEKNTNTLPEGDPEHKGNPLENLKIDETISSMREKLKDISVLDLIDDGIFWGLYPGLHMYLRLMYKFDVRGRENFPLSGPLMLVMNHQSNMDPFFLNLAAPRKVMWFVREKNVNVPIMKSLVQSFGFIILKPEMADVDATGKVVELLKDGKVVGMFPEGQATTDGSLGKFHRAAARFCIEMKIPYIPVAIIGALNAFPPGTKPFQGKIGEKVEIRFGRPVTVDPNMKQNPENAGKVAEQMQNDVQNLMDRVYT